jgi:hypothetical protein
MKTTRTVLVSLVAVLALMNAIVALTNLSIPVADLFSIGVGGLTALGVVLMLTAEPAPTTYAGTSVRDHRTPHVPSLHIHHLSARTA